MKSKQSLCFAKTLYRAFVHLRRLMAKASCKIFEAAQGYAQLLYQVSEAIESYKLWVCSLQNASSEMPHVD